MPNAVYGTLTYPVNFTITAVSRAENESIATLPPSTAGKPGRTFYHPKNRRISQIQHRTSQIKRRKRQPLRLPATTATHPQRSLQTPPETTTTPPATTTTPPSPTSARPIFRHFPTTSDGLRQNSAFYSLLSTGWCCIIKFKSDQRRRFSDAKENHRLNMDPSACLCT